MRSEWRWCVLLVAVTACDRPESKPDVRPEAVSPSASTTSASTALPPDPPEPPPPPTLGRAPVTNDELQGVVGLHTIMDAVMVSAGPNVYRLKEHLSVELAGTIPEKKSVWGVNVIQDVFGRWPALLGVEFHSPFGRAPVPTYAPLKGASRR